MVTEGEAPPGPQAEKQLHSQAGARGQGRGPRGGLICGHVEAEGGRLVRARLTVSRPGHPSREDTRSQVRFDTLNAETAPFPTPSPHPLLSSPQASSQSVPYRHETEEEEREAERNRTFRSILPLRPWAAR